MNEYGVYEQNSIQDIPDAVREAEREETVDITDKRLARVERLRLLSDPGFPHWDVSYCWGILKDGTRVWVSLPGLELRRSTRARRVPSISAQLVAYCKEQGVYAKGLGLLDPLVLSTLV